MVGACNLIVGVQANCNKDGTKDKNRAIVLIANSLMKQRNGHCNTKQSIACVLFCHAVSRGKTYRYLFCSLSGLKNLTQEIVAQQLQASEWCFGAAARLQRVVYLLCGVLGLPRGFKEWSIFFWCWSCDSKCDQDTGAEHHRI